MPIVTRQGKGAPLTAAELDNNFILLSVAAGVAVGGPGTADGSEIDETTAVGLPPLIFDVTGVSRPIAVDITVGSGDQILMAITSDAEALLDPDHASWTIVRPGSNKSVIEFVIDVDTVGVLVLRTVGSSSGSSVRVYAPQRPPSGDYDPTYDPTYDVSSEGLNDTRRFLDQATMGPLALQAASFSGTFGSWIEAQALLTDEPDLSSNSAVDNNSGQSTTNATSAEVYRKMLQSDAQLRWRVAHAISSFIPVGNNANNRQIDYKKWWAGLTNNALGNFKDILRHSIKSRSMGFWLNNFANNGRNGVPPNQNFARELLQLFSLGQELLNKDGTKVYDNEGRVARAYTQPDINSLSRLLCGWASPGIFGVTGTIPADRSMSLAPALAYNGFALTFFGYDETDYPVFGPQGQTVGTPTVNGYTPTEQNILDRMEACLTIIMEQPSAGPFVCGHLIRKLVTDNPTPQYIRRVVAAWDNNGSGVVGDLKAVVRAILLDTEARGVSKPDNFGRAMEPVLMWTRAYRYAQQQNIPAAWNATTNDHIWHWTTEGGGAENVLNKMGNQVASPRSVFYDYPYDFELTPGFRASAAAIHNTQGISAHIGIGLSNAAAQLTVDVNPNNAWGAWLGTALIAFYDAEPGSTTDKNNALVDRMYADLFQGRTPPAHVLTELHAFAAYLDTIPSPTTRKKVGWLNWAMTTLNEYWRIN